MDRPFRLTRFPSQAAFSKRTLDVSLRELSARIKDAKADDKADLPWLKLAVFGSDRTDRNSLRHNANVISITGIEADYDGGAITPEEAHDLLKRAGVTALIYTTPSHTTGKPRWRVLASTSTELPPEDRTRLLARLNGLFDGALDPSSFTLSQAYYYGNAAGKPRVRTFLVEGRRYIDEAEDLDATAIGKGRGSIENAPARNQLAAERTGLDFEDFADAVMLIPNDGSEPGNDGRDWWLSIIQGIHHETGGSRKGLRLAQEWSRQWPGYDSNKTASAWQSFRRREGPLRTGESVLGIARRHGWQETRTVDVDPDEFDDLPPLPKDRAKGMSRLTFLSPAECAVAESRGYVIKGLAAPGDVGCIFGAPGVGKSLIAPHLGYAVAQGRSAFGMRTKPGNVFYVAAEDETGMRGRVRALRDHWDDASDFTLVGGCSDLLSKGSADLKALLAAIEERRPALIFVDTLAMAFPGLEENDAASMGRVVAVARQLASFGAAVILVHHDTKEGGGTPRGHSVLNGALDMAIHLTKGEDGIVRGQLTKNRNGPCDRDIAFRIATRDFGEDKDGDPITAALVEELDASRRPALHLSPSERAALNVLDEIGGSAGEKEWLDECVAGLSVSESGSQVNRRKVARKAMRGLVRKAAVKFVEGIYSTDSPPIIWDDDDDESNDK